jgi:hypothetical protein
MIKAKGFINGRETFIIGLSFANLNKFLNEPLDTFIRINAEEVGIPFDILIYSGETEEDCIKLLPIETGNV